eukprot:7967049-Ditylum_brightwellii.AAC.1
MKVLMKECIEESIEEFPEELGEPCTSPAADHLFRVDKHWIKLVEKKAQQFHTTVTRVMFVCKRARPDIQPTITFLTTQWWVDGTFTVHANMRSHTGTTMSLGKDSIYSASLKQKINTRSSTETELVA